MSETTSGSSNAFLDAITTMEDGGIASDLDKRLREVVQEARRTGKEGCLTLKLTLTPRGADSMFVSADVGQKMPKAEKPVSVFFDNEDGAIVREHPKQTTLPFVAKAKAAQK